MKHTFLFTESTWIAKGTYYDEKNNPVEVTGESFITHLKKTWFLNSSMILPGESPTELKNDYEIVPFAKDVTSWKSVNPALGTLLGSFAVVEDSIISLFSSQKGEYFGTEVLTMINESEYTGKGVLYSPAGKISSWSVKLTRE
ncbi:hypothetical protein [Pelotomaculum propionicicum]|uniref:Uncharacterized protein n=1 Tax=Pelotomaculum propionicicum TaxID=258475 RepID=A0A4Y7RMC5_9FIRM|nr:hypothetical protein [Pelotomaculum propionicicum]NLI12930.1 hypothetical protein [Peptococcaceae bacterium]TEB09832.1 hypothetical protein Pmgp_02833 [Pelotomaculum propionicicum]